MHGAIKKLEIEVFSVAQRSYPFLLLVTNGNKSKMGKKYIMKTFPKGKGRNSKNISITVTFIVHSIGLFFVICSLNASFIQL